MRRCWPLAVAWLLNAAALHGTQEQVTTRDSAGVRITSASAPAAGVQVGVGPLAVIGGATGEGAYQLWQVADAYRAPEGSTFVSVGGDRQVRLFDAAGRHLASYGGAGQGPAEFHTYSGMRLFPTGDGGVAVEDNGNRRIHFLDSRAAAGEALQFDAVTGLLGTPRGRFADGSWLAVAPVTGDLARGDGGRAHFEIAQARIEPDWSRGKTLLTLRSQPRWVMDVGGRSVGYRIPFTQDDAALPAGDDLLVVRGGAAEVRRYDAAGRLEAIHRWSAPKRAVADHFARFRDVAVRDADRSRRADMARFLAGDVPLPDVLPQVRRLLVDATGNIWAERWRLPWEEDARWDVLAADGRWVASVAFPPRFELTQVGAEFALGVQRDELDVEAVVVLPLARIPPR